MVILPFPKNKLFRLSVKLKYPGILGNRDKSFFIWAG